jgi:hypothetical protein
MILVKKALFRRFSVKPFSSCEILQPIVDYLPVESCCTIFWDACGILNYYNFTWNILWFC